MGRFSENGLKKSVGESSATDSNSRDAYPSVAEEVTNSLDNVEPETTKPLNQYTQAQMRPVNVGGFRAPLIVRIHWQNQAKLSSEAVATQLRAYLTERYGLPDGITEDDLLC
jgi:hypothetical protein